MLVQITTGLVALVAGCAPVVAQRTLVEVAPAAASVTSDCSTVTFTLHGAEPDHLYYLEYGSAPPLGAHTDADGNLTNTQNAAYVGSWYGDIYDPETDTFLVREHFDCAAPGCS